MNTKDYVQLFNRVQNDFAASMGVARLGPAWLGAAGRGLARNGKARD